MWRKKFECVALLKKWSDEEKICYLKLFLEGDPFKIVDHLVATGDVSLDTIMTQLERQFCPTRNASLQKLETVSLDGKPTLFLVELRCLLASCYPSLSEKQRDELVKDYFLKKMPSHILPHLISVQHKTIEKIAALADQLIHMAPLSNAFCNAALPSPKIDNLQSEVARLQKQVEDLMKKINMTDEQVKDKKASNWRPKQPIQCFICGRNGHIARNCRARSSENY